MLLVQNMTDSGGCLREQMREAFEKWAKAHGYAIGPADGVVGYSMRTGDAWAGWQAAIAASPPVPAQAAASPGSVALLTKGRARVALEGYGYVPQDDVVCALEAIASGAAVVVPVQAAGEGAHQKLLALIACSDMKDRERIFTKDEWRDFCAWVNSLALPAASAPKEKTK